MKLILFFTPFLVKVVSLFLPHNHHPHIHKYIFLQSRHLTTNKYSTHFLDNYNTSMLTNNYLETSPFLQNKKMITISPGGYKGFYMMGIANFIREKYDLNNYIFSGASAGAWISLLLCYKGDPKNIQQCIISSNIDTAKSIADIEKKMMENILANFTTDDFDLRRLFIGITTIYKFKLITAIVSDFENLEDAIQCCMASSHIPFVTGSSLTFLYKQLYSFDGGFSKYPYLNFKGFRSPALHIHPSIWSASSSASSKKSLLVDIADITTLFSRERYNFIELIKEGYTDSIRHQDELDRIFIGE